MTSGAGPQFPWVLAHSSLRCWEMATKKSSGRGAEKFHGQKSLAGYSPKGCKELDTTEQLNMYLFLAM